MWDEEDQFGRFKLFPIFNIIKWVVSFSIVRIKLIPGRINVQQAILKCALTKSPNIRLRRHPFDYIHIKWRSSNSEKIELGQKIALAALVQFV